MNEFFSDGFQWWYIWPILAIGGGILRRFSHGRARDRRRYGPHGRYEHDVRYGHDGVDRRAEREHAESRARDVEALMADHDRVNAAWLEYELDVAKLIDYPMMSDVREPLTVEFLRAKRAADGLRPDTAEQITVDSRLTEYRQAVRAYEVAFDIAEREATRVKDRHFTDAERQRLGTARRLLAMAADTGASPAERRTAYSRVRKELDGLLVLPEESLAALETMVRRQVDGGESLR